MRKPQSRAGLSALGLALLVVTLALAACAPTPQGPAATAQPSAATAPAATQAPAATTATAPQATSGADVAVTGGTAVPGSQEVGASANLSAAAKYVNHWKGDPNAKVVVIEVSDFQ